MVAIYGSFQSINHPETPPAQGRLKVKCKFFDCCETSFIMFKIIKLREWDVSIINIRQWKLISQDGFVYFTLVFMVTAYRLHFRTDLQSKRYYIHWHSEKSFSLL